MKSKTAASAPKIEIAILAGGRASRMGTPKASLPLAGKSLLAHVLDLAIETGLPVRVIRNDIVPECGPIGGVYTALKQTRAAAVLFLSCDMPFVTPEMLRTLIQRSEKGRLPIFATDGQSPGFPFLLPRPALANVRRRIGAGRLSLRELASGLGAKLHTFPVAPLENLNNRRDYQAAVERMRGVKPPVLAVSGLNIRRGKVALVSDFSWSVGPGEHWVILGANGSGKTSLLSALLGYLTPTSGEISVLGEVYGDADWRALRSKIGLVSSSVRQMMPENEPAWITVASGRYAMVDFWGTPSRHDKMAAYKLLDQIECGEIAERDWAWLSQGERQRVLIGRALMAQPALLILDEPCAGLDPVAREHFLGFLERLGRQARALALVLVTHHVEEIMPVFTHALLLKGGRKTAAGPIGATLNSARLSEAFAAPLRLGKLQSRYHLTVGENRRVII